MARWLREPDHPPLPTARYFPFQWARGSQTSILISESGVGRRVAAIWQYCGRSEVAAMVWATVMAVSGRRRDFRSSHVAARAGVVRRASVITNSKRAGREPAPLVFFMAGLLR